MALYLHLATNSRAVQEWFGKENNIVVFFSIIVIYVFRGAESEFKLCHLQKLERAEKLKYKMAALKICYKIQTLFLLEQFLPTPLLRLHVF